MVPFTVNIQTNKPLNNHVERRITYLRTSLFIYTTVQLVIFARRFLYKVPNFIAWPFITF